EHKPKSLVALIRISDHEHPARSASRGTPKPCQEDSVKRHLLWNFVAHDALNRAISTGDFHGTRLDSLASRHPAADHSAALVVRFLSLRERTYELTKDKHGFPALPAMRRTDETDEYAQ